MATKKTLEKKTEQDDATKEEKLAEKAAKADSSKKIVPKDVDPDEYVTVRNGFQGALVYKNKKTGELLTWESFGAEQEMTLRDLKNAKNSSKKFFINNWFMFDEPWIPDYLGLKQYYKFAISIDEFDDLFVKTPDELENILTNMSNGQKKSVAYRARQLISAGEIDSNKVISTLEKHLGVDLIER